MLLGGCEAHEAETLSNVAAMSVSEKNLSRGDFTFYCLHIEHVIHCKTILHICNGLYHIR
jgi:hypothetical protein